MKIRLTLSVTLILIAMVIFQNVAYSGELPSCIEVAANRQKPGAAPDCAPMIIDNNEAFQLLSQTRAQKLGPRWCIFLTEKAFEDLKRDKNPYELVWEMLAMTVSATQTLYEDMRDIYIAIMPKNETEMAKFIRGEYGKILAYAKSTLPNPFETEFPPKHRHSVYRLIVYDFMSWKLGTN